MGKFALKVGHIMRKPGFPICEQQRRRSVYASVQSDQHLMVRCLDSIICIQGCPFITLCVGSIELDRVISELRYKEMIL